MTPIGAEELAALWGALPLPVLVLDGADRIRHVNTAAQEFLSTGASQLVGRPLEAHAGAASPVMALVAQARAGHSSLSQYNVELTWPDRPARPVDLHAALLLERAGEVMLVIHPRAMAEKMDHSLSFRSAARSVAGMAAMLAHEIRNPLAGISGAAQLLGMNLAEPDRELTELICEETDRIRKLVERVERFGDIGPVVRRPVNIHDVLGRARLAAAAGFARHVRFVEDFDPSLPPAAGDADQLHQAIVNLIRNAAEAAPAAGGVIRLATAFRAGIRLALPGGRREGLPLEVSITDNGPGVPEEIRRCLFEPFVTTKAGGSGLGLALVSKIVADHGGVVECDSLPGRTTFRILLPVWQEDRGPRARAAPEGGA